MAFVLEYKWLLAILTEVAFLLLTGAFVVSRYRLGWRRISLVALALLALNELAYLALAALDYQETGKISAYQIIAVIWVLYLIFEGKKDFEKIDRFLRQKMARWRGEASPPAGESLKTMNGNSASSPQEQKAANLTGREHAKKERRDWYAHVLIFAVGQAVLFVLGESWIAARLSGEVPEHLSALMQVGRIWCIVVIVDGLWSLSYTVFPRRAKK
jgi:hypothetical protein